MKLKAKSGKPTFVLTLTAEEAEALYLTIVPTSVRSHTSSNKVEKMYEHAVEIEAALADALDDFGIR